MGIKVTKAADGQQAVEAFAASPPGGFDAILMDVMMPVRDGHEATRAIRAMDRPDAKTIPIFAMTANAFTEDRRKALESASTPGGGESRRNTTRYDTANQPRTERMYYNGTERKDP